MRSNGNVKFAAGAAAFAVVISVIASAIRGVPFGTVVLRAFVGGVSFAVLGFAAMAVVDKYFPELRDALSSKSAAGDTGGDAESDAVPNGEDSGSSVDITLDGENPLIDTEGASYTGDEAGTDIPMAESMDDAFSEDGAMFSAEATEVRSEGDDSFDPAEEAEEVEEIESVEEAEEVESSDGVEDTGDTAMSRLDGLDTLDGPAGGGSMSQGRTVDLLGSDEEPETIAKAVRTLMNRDQEG